MGEKTVEKARSATNEARRYTETYPHQRQRASSSGRPSFDTFSSRSDRSASPQVIITQRNRTPRSSHEPTLQPQAQSDAHAFHDTRPQSITPSRKRPHKVVPSSSLKESKKPPARPRFEPPVRLQPGSSSSTSTHSLQVPCSSDTSQPRVTRRVTDPSPSVRKQRSRIYGHRVRDNGTGPTVEVSEWPEGILGSNEHSTSPSQETLTSTGHASRGHPGNAQEPQGQMRSSSIVSRKASIHEQRGGMQKHNGPRKLGDEYKPCGPFTESDREERNRRRHSPGGSSED